MASSDKNDEEKEQLREALNARLARSLQWDITPTQPQEPPSRKHAGDAESEVKGDGDDAEETDEEEPPETFEFRLFGSSKPATTVVLEKDRPFKPGSGSIVARRPASFYLSRPSQREREEYASALMTWEQVMEKSRQRMWGLERPWKTIASLTASDGKPKRSQKAALKIVAEAREEGSKRKRLGKKTRIARRKRDRAAAAKKEAEEKAKAEKEDHVKAKKKRLNHVKKVRARAKAKAKRAAERAAAGLDPVEEDDASVDGGSADEAGADISMEGT
ncbi:DUF2011 domain-containing protein [Candidatus Bathyarchaeota archaeon]|nr:DUF2011 domain-containing protein [Candidatus Bathyarchaeota archaeon]